MRSAAMGLGGVWWLKSRGILFLWEAGHRREHCEQARVDDCMMLMWMACWFEDGWRLESMRYSWLLSANDQ